MLGAKANFILYSVVMTALANNVHPERYLEYLYEKLPNTKQCDIHTLDPWSPSLPKALKILIYEQALLEKALALRPRPLGAGVYT
ncbi:MAG: transposase domain-containing protein [Oscillospiraceae bacterium]|jgi:hypothetical protein|nr:transposase domain-containing protein [Oscillospiraceae bacterium]